jgi:hypothetical protein
MRKDLGDDPVRVTIRLPKALHDAPILGQRDRPTLGSGISDIVRNALRHCLACPEQHRADEAERLKRERIEAARAPLQPLPGERHWDSVYRQRTVSSTDRP